METKILKAPADRVWSLAVAHVAAGLTLRQAVDLAIREIDSMSGWASKNQGKPIWEDGGQFVMEIDPCGDQAFASTPASGFEDED